MATIYRKVTTVTDQDGWPVLRAPDNTGTETAWKATAASPRPTGGVWVLYRTAAAQHAEV